MITTAMGRMTGERTAAAQRSGQGIQYPPPGDALAQDRRLVRRFTIGYITALSLIAILSGAIHLILDGIIDRQSDSAAIINIAGRQRMLSQRTAMLATELVALGNEQTRNDLLVAVDLMDRSHTALTRGDPAMGIVSNLSPAMKVFYFEGPADLDRRMGIFLDKARRIADPASPPAEREAALKHVQEEARRPLLQSLDDAVRRFEEEANARVDSLRTVQRGVLIILLSTLLLEALFIFQPLVNKVRDFARRLYAAATTDSLSGALNRSSFMEAVEREMARSQRSGRPVTLLLMDLDHFKSINDTHGHPSGDAVIRGFARMARDQMRTVDTVGRVGGEEFAALLPETGTADAVTVAERLRRAVADTPGFGEAVVPVTVSIGVATLAPPTADSPGETLEQLMIRADKALYRAKATGRNRTVEAEAAAA